MRKGSPEGYNAEIGLAEPTQRPQTGEPNERQRHPLYRIRCPQENHQLLRQRGRRRNRGGRQAASHTQSLRQWAQQRTEAWRGAMEATMFSGWIYDTLKPFAAELEMGHPAQMKAIGASKKKSDRLDARKIA